MAAKMVKGKRYNLVVLHLAFLYKALDEFSAVHGEVNDLQALVHNDRMARDVFSSSARVISAEVSILPFLILDIAKISEVECDSPLKLFWFRDQVSI